MINKSHDGSSMDNNLQVEDFDYFLPEALIAQEPLPQRDRSRLLVLHKDGGEVEHRQFTDILDYINPGDVLVVNDTRVIPARLMGRKTSGARVEVLLLHSQTPNLWEALVRPGRKLPPGTVLLFGEGRLEARVLERTPCGGRLLEFTCAGDFYTLLNELGQTPLPPYIKKELADKSRYQTIYARESGSVAAPTAGLHFTGELLQEIGRHGVKTVSVLLHVGLGTFRPVNAARVEDHHMHEEYYSVSGEAALAINEARARKGRVVAVGTTTVRCLESASDASGLVRPGAGLTSLFIYPGYRFQVVDALITNFHLPRSTLLMMISALAGRDKILAAYREAIEQGYRFFSFGDAMLII